jgi:hypothetical protein
MDQKTNALHSCWERLPTEDRETVLLVARILADPAGDAKLHAFIRYMCDTLAASTRFPS